VDYILDEGKSFWYSLSMGDINIIVSLVCDHLRARFSPSVFAKVHLSGLELVSASAFSAMHSLLSLEAF
jgi:hypothetical protein